MAAETKTTVAAATPVGPASDQPVALPATIKARNVSGFTLNLSFGQLEPDEEADVPRSEFIALGSNYLEAV